MGRHTVPGTGTPEPDRGFWVRSAVAAVVLALVAAFFLTRAGGDDDQVGTSGKGSGSPSAGAAASTSTPGTASTASSTPTPSATASAAPSPSSTARPPTLAFTVRYPAYITVRVPGGRTLVSRLFKAGAKATFDQKVLQVVNGRPRAVRFVVNGKPRKPGRSDQAETFTVRRK